MAEEPKFENLIGQDLAGYKMVTMHEVYKIDNDGRRSTTLGFFKSAAVASAFARNQSRYHETTPALVITNGEIGFTVTEHQCVKLFKDEDEIPEIRKRILGKLTSSERKILGLIP